jgi:hypothetical protein
MDQQCFVAAQKVFVVYRDLNNPNPALKINDEQHSF